MNEHALRVMAVLDPLKVTISNYPNSKTEDMVAHDHPQHSEMGTRTVPFSKTLYIERDDFMEDAPSKYFRLSVGREV